MRIGIDLDNTICRTIEIMQDKILEYSKEKEIAPLIVMNDEKEEEEFLRKYLKDIYKCSYKKKCS